MVISNIHDQVDKDIFGPNYRQQCWTTVVVRYVRSTRRQVGYRTTGWDCDSVRKVIAGQERLRASGTVTSKLVTWLAARGYIDRGSADHATGRAQDASRDLPVADRLGGLLHDVAPAPPRSTSTRSTIKTGSRITSRSATWSPVGSGSRAASDRSPSHAGPAISHDRDGQYPSRRHGPRTAGICSRSASSTPDPRHIRSRRAGAPRCPRRQRESRHGCSATRGATATHERVASAP